jgi:predicted nucleic acid-binding protein
MDHKQVTNEDIHNELKKLHLSIQVLTTVVSKLHDEVRHIHNQHLEQHHSKRWYHIWR